MASQTKSSNAKSTRDRNTAFWATLSLLGLGVAFVTVYAALTGPATWIGAQLMTAGAATVVGALLGFLFGIPRTLQGSRTSENSSRNDSAPGLRSDEGLQYESSTNLEQISDWLTKILVGVGLTQLHEIGPQFQSLAGTLTLDHTVPGGTAVTVASLVFFSTIAFLFGYLWTRLVYSPVLVESEWRIVRKLRRELAKKTELLTDLGSAVNHGVGKQPEVDKRAGTDNEPAATTTPGVDLPPPTIPDDPQKGRFGGKARTNGRELRAEVVEIPGSNEWFLVRLRVVRTGGHPLRGEVCFHLHDTFPNPVECVAANGKSAELELMSYGAFTVGAVADGGETLLELDLAELRDAPRLFRTR